MENSGFALTEFGCFFVNFMAAFMQIMYDVVLRPLFSLLIVGGEELEFPNFYETLTC